MGKIGRNDLCPCGSGKKFKKCCLDGSGSVGKQQDLAVLYNEQGNACADRGELDEAIIRYEKALAINPHFAGACNNLGIVLKEKGLLAEAISCYQRAIEIQPAFAGAYSNLGVALKAQGRYEDAVDCYRQALLIVPDSLQVNTNLGNILADMGRFQEAIDCYGRILGKASDLATCLSVGTAMHAMGRTAEAVAGYERALESGPDAPMLLNNLAAAYNSQGRLDETIACYNRALAADPEYADAYCGLGSTLKDRGLLPEALDCFRRALAIRPDYAAAYSSLLLTLHYDVSCSRDDLFAAARQYARTYELPLQSAPRESAPVRQAGTRLKVGLVSADLRNHPVGHFLEGVLRAVDQQEFALFAYANQQIFDPLSERIAPCFEAWVPVAGMSDEQLADRIREDGIDLLIDLSGHSCGNRLLTFARRPAPVQATWLGYANTTGLEGIDFILADPVTILPDEEHLYTEKVWRLPETYVCFTPPDPDIPLTGLPAMRNRHVTFGSFGNPAKLNDAVISCWSDILRLVPGSVLLLKYRNFGHESECRLFRERFRASGIDPARLRFAGESPRGEYLAAYGEVDLCLDPFPFPGLTTTCEALWMGVPTLTLRVERGMYGHNGELVMKSVGLGDWVAGSVEEYRERAVDLAGDPQRLADLRAGLRQALLTSPLCATERFARHLQDAFRGMMVRTGAPSRK